MAGARESCGEGDAGVPGQVPSDFTDFCGFPKLGDPNILTLNSMGLSEKRGSLR